MIKRRWSRFRTSTKITIAMVSVAAFAVLSTSGFFFNQMVRDLEREESASFAAMQRQVVLASEAELDRAETVAVSIAGLPGVVEAFGARDRKALSQVVDGVFPRIKQLGVSQAQFHLAPATSFFRMHKPGRYGDDLSSFRHTVVACNQAHKVVRAAEAGRFGIGFRAVVPVRKGDEYLGSFEIGADAGSSFIEGLKRATGDEWVLIPLDRSESGTTVDPGKTIATASSATEAIGDWDYFSALKEDGVSAVERRTVQGMPVALVAQPMKGFDGTVIAHLIAVRDRSASVAAMTRALWVTVLLSLVLIGVSAVLTRVLAVQISRPLQVLVHRTREMMGGMPEHSRIENGQDAVTELTLSIASMADYLKDATRNADALAVGDLGYEIQTRGNDDHLGTAFCRLQDTLRGVLVEIERLIQAAKEGELQTRSDGQDLEGGWAQVINEINDLMGVLESPVSVVSSALEAIAAKDLRARVDNEFQGRFAVMGQGVNQAAEVLDRGIQQIAQSGEQVAGAAKEIAAASNELAQGASSQAESLASTMEDLKLAVESAAQNRQHAYAAREIVDKATSSTQEGVQAMERLADSMGHISASAQDIGRIVRTIDEIAFQTNLLALNAAVEAARAGEAGKGFAVVAEEVRSLAMRSAEASRQTGEMIGTALERAEEGNSYCSEVVALFEKIRSAVSKSHSVMEEISSEADRQSESIHAVQDRIDEIGRITERSAAGAEETAASAAELASQSDSMRSLVGDFQLSK